jgi:alkylation response protein AidB-like acyl-CoA dehydrogenase
MQTTAADREQFRKGIRSFLEQRSAEAEVRRLIEDPLGYDPSVWAQLSDQLGLPGVLIAEADGGQGLSYVELALALEESGRTLLSAPLLSSSALATAALLIVEAPDTGDVLGKLASGSLIATVAIDDVAGAPVQAAEHAAGEAGGWQLTGAKTRVLDGQLAGLFLVTASHGSGTGLFAVSADATGLTRTELKVLDLTRRQSRLDFDGTPARLIAADFGAGLRRFESIAAILVSAEILGAAARALEIAVEYAQTREQFGAKIGSFQAIKHLLADQLASVEQMRAAVTSGVRTASSDTATDADLTEVASVVKAYCSEFGPVVVESLIQVLGGIGYTWEHPAHLYLRRVRTLGVLYGDAAQHRRQLAVLFGLISA